MARANGLLPSSEHSDISRFTFVENKITKTKKSKNSPKGKIVPAKMDETEYLMSSKVNHQRIKSALKSKKSTTYKNLEEFKRAYNL